MIGTSLSGVTFISVPGMGGNITVQLHANGAGLFGGYTVIARY